MFGERIEEQELAADLGLATHELELLTASEEAARASEPEPERQVIPEGLDEWLPGPHLAAVLSSIDDSRLNGYDLVVLMRARARQIAHEQAGYYGTVAEVARAIPTGPDGSAERTEEWFEYASDELRAALTLTRRAADAEIDLAYQLEERLPRVSEALLAGELDLRQARTIVHGVLHLSDESAGDVADAILGEAPGLTTGQIRARLQRLCIEVDPADAESRYQRGVEDRRYVTEVETDGTAGILGLQLPIDRVSVANRRVNRLARSLKTADESRTIDQIRADVFLDLLTGSSTGSPESEATVDIVVDLATLAGLEDKAGEIPGWGPVIADVARQVVAEQRGSQWRYTVTDNGRPVATGTTRRRPTAAIARQVRACYPTCVFPGCRMPATECDLDHRVPWAEGGSTDVDHLEPMCRHDHIVRHRAGWRVHRDTDGSHVFTSRLGHTYRAKGLPP